MTVPFTVSTVAGQYALPDVQMVMTAVFTVPTVKVAFKDFKSGG